MKSYSIKNHSGQKTLIVNNLLSVNVRELYNTARKLNIPFAVKTETGVQVWGSFTIAEYLGINDVTKL